MNICLATLDKATAQEVFDQVAVHMFKQNARSVREIDEQCQYRGYGGLMCAAGCLIADDEYSPAMEGFSWDSLAVTGKVPKAHQDLILLLQEIHDHTPLEHWYHTLKMVAFDNKLSDAHLMP